MTSGQESSHHRPGRVTDPSRSADRSLRTSAARFVPIVFVVATAFFAWWQLRDQWSDIVTAMTGLPPGRWLAAGVLIGLGTLTTAIAWFVTLTRFGHRIAWRDALAILFVGQLGRYLPGSLWSVGAQAKMARRCGVPVRVSVATGLIFIGWHLATAVAVGSTAVLVDVIDVSLPTWLAAVALSISVASTSPPVINRVGTRLVGGQAALAGRWADWAGIWLVFVLTWSMFGCALALLNSPDGATLPVGTSIGAFTLAYAIGLVVVIAPAGLGAREVAVVSLVSPAIGTSQAAAAVLLSRVLFVVTDFLIASITWGLHRRTTGHVRET